MADTKITALAAITTVDPAADVLPIVDVSDTSMAASGTTKKITSNQILGAGGTATLASATISGDLTVDTSTLKVDSANNRVGILTATPGAPLDILANTLADALLIRGNDNANCKIRMANSGASGEEFSLSVGYPGASNSSFVLRSITAGINRYVADQTGAHFWATNAGTAMTLNSTGLGVGGSPSAKLHIVGGASATVEVARFAASSGPYVGIGTEGTNYTWIQSFGGKPLQINPQGNDTILNPSSGNVGVGRTPAYKLDIGGTGTQTVRIQTTTSGDPTLTFEAAGADGGSILYDRTNGGMRFDISAITGAMRLSTTGNLGVGVTPSVRLHASAAAPTRGIVSKVQNSSSGTTGSYLSIAAVGANVWSLGLPAGSADFALFSGRDESADGTERMRLTASGDLLVGKASASVTTVGFQTLPSGEASVAMSATTGAATTLNVYSTGAAAYRFFVGMNGTISATNTTISAISDARFKENVQDIDVGLGAILALKPRKFDWKEGKGKNIKGDRGFIAQEFEQVFPQLVDEWKDPAPEGEAPYKSVRQDLIPVLVKAIQELAARVEALEA